jgi:hypothetical protein
MSAGHGMRLDTRNFFLHLFSKANYVITKGPATTYRETVRGKLRTTTLELIQHQKILNKII